MTDAHWYIVTLAVMSKVPEEPLGGRLRMYTHTPTGEKITRAMLAYSREDATGEAEGRENAKLSRERRPETVRTISSTPPVTATDYELIAGAIRARGEEDLR